MKILCVVPTRMADLDPDCLSSVSNQTVPVSKVIISCLRLKGGTTASRVSIVLNRGLARTNLADYDYLFRLDCDTVLKPTFLEYHLKGSPDLVGTGGYAMLIKVKPFLELMGGKFNSVSDDSYILYKFQYEGKQVRRVNDDLLRTRVRAHSKKDQMFIGSIYYRIGYEPIHVFGFLFAKIMLRRHPVKYAVTNAEWQNNMWFFIAGYLVTWLKRERKFDFADRVWNYQVRRLLPFGRKIEGGIRW